MRHSLETSYMDSSWKKADKCFFLEISLLVKLRPFEKKSKVKFCVLSQKVLMLETIGSLASFVAHQSRRLIGGCIVYLCSSVRP